MGRAQWLVVLVAAAMLVPLGVSVVHVLAYPQRFGGDHALLQIRVSDVFTSHTPLVGSYQRFGWNQPGPAYLYLLAIPYRLFGSSYAALQIGALVFNGLAIGGALLVAHKRGGLGLYLWTAALLAVVMHAMEPTSLASFWEPDVSVLALVLMVFVVLDVAMGRAWTIPVAVVLAVLLVQGWATTAPIALALLVWGLVAFAFRWFAPRDATSGTRAARQSWLAPAMVSAAVVVVLWIPPVFQQLRPGTGNFGLILRFFHTPHTVLGLTDAYKLTSLQLGTRPPWAGAGLPLQPFESVVSTSSAPAVPILLLLLVAAVIFAAMRRDRSLALGATVIVGIAAEIVSLSRLIGPVFVEIMQPTWVCGVGAALAAGWCFFSPLRGGARRAVARVGVPVLTIAVLGFGVANTIQAGQGLAAPPAPDQVLEHLADRAVPIARGARGPVLVQSNSRAPGGAIDSLGPEVLAATLHQAGVDVVVNQEVANRYGDFRAHPATAVLELRLSVAADRPTGDGWRVVATLDPLTAAQRATRDRLKAQLDARIGVTTSQKELITRLASHPELRGLARRYSALIERPAMVLSARPITPAA